MKKTFFFILFIEFSALKAANILYFLSSKIKENYYFKLCSKSSFYLFISLIIGAGAYAQDDSIYHEGFYSYDYTYRKIIPIILSFNHISNYEINPDFRSSSITPNINPQFKTKKGFELGLGYQYKIGEKYSSSQSLCFIIVYKTSSSESKGLITNQDYLEKIIDNKKAIVFDLRAYEQSSLGLDISYRLHPFQNIYLSGGAFAGYLISSNYSEKINVKDSSNFIANTDIKNYENNNKTAVIYDDEIENINKFNYGLKFETGIILYFNSIDINPSISYNYSINKVIPNLDWSVNSLNIGIKIIINSFFIY